MIALKAILKKSTPRLKREDYVGGAVNGVQGDAHCVMNSGGTGNLCIIQRCGVARTSSKSICGNDLYDRMSAVWLS